MNARLNVDGSYTNDGVHSGTGRVVLRNNNDTIAGTGLISTSNLFRVNNGRMIIAGSDLTRTGQNIRCPNNDTLFNFGNLTTNRGLTGNGTTTFYNGTGANLNIQRALVTNGTLVASDLNNTITYNRTGSNNITINVSHDGYHNLTIDGNNINSDKIVSSAVRVLNDLTINGSTLLQTDTVSIYVRGDFIYNGGDFLFNQGTVVLNGSSAQLISGELTFRNIICNSAGGVTIGSDTVTLLGQMTVPNGTFNTNNRLVLESISGRDGHIGEIATGSSVSGDVIVQQHILQGATDWRFMGSPITNATFEDWDVDFVTSGFPGSDFPNFNFTSIYGYDETVIGHQDSGFFTITGSDNIIPGKSYWVYCGDSLNGTNAFTVEVTGPINQGPIDLSPTDTPLTGIDEDRWNLVSNPYPCPIDWDSPNWTRLNIDSAVYIWNTNLDQYASYSNGVGLFSGSNIITSGQAFCVKANLALPVLVAQESVKYDTNITFLRSKPKDDLITRLTLDQNNQLGETVIRVNKRATSEFEGNLLAYHIPGFGNNKSNIYTEIDENQIAINAISASGKNILPLKMSSLEGNAQLRYQNDIYRDDFCVILWNTTTNEQLLLDQTRSVDIEFESDETILEYMVVISRNEDGIKSAYEQLLIIAEQPSQSENIGYYTGQTIVLNNASTQKEYRLLDATCRTIRKGRAQNGQIPVNELAPSVYLLQMDDGILKFIHQ